MSVISYPAQVTSYSISYIEEKAQLHLSGFERPLNDGSVASASAVTLARIDFGTAAENNPKGYKAFINRGGFLQASRPTWQLASMLVLLEKNEPLVLDGNGNLSKNSKIVEPRIS